MDMSGGAAALEATAAIAELGLPLNLLWSCRRSRTCRAAARPGPAT